LKFMLIAGVAQAAPTFLYLLIGLLAATNNN
jgi:hypothetical protein